jgi:hypothetical protein
MASKNKKNKEKNCYSNHGHALKKSETRMKKRMYYNSSQRKKLKKIDRGEI